MYVNQILTSLGYDFITERTFPDLLSNKGHKLRFDFYVKAKIPFCIEYDGIQHYSPTFGEKQFAQQLENDALKNQYCQVNHIPLLRIPYWVSSCEEIKNYINNFINKEIPALFE